MDKTKMAANLFRQGDSMQTYQAVIDSINGMSLQVDDGDQQEETMPAELLYSYETAISGVSLYSGDALTKPVPVAYSESAGSAASKFCLNGTLNETLVKGKIVVCDGASGNKYEKSENVKQAKGVGMILVNSVGDELSADPHILPTVRVGDTADAAFQAGDLNYPSFAVNFKGGVQNGSLEYTRTVTNVGTPTSSYTVKVEVPNGVLVIVNPKTLSFNKVGQKLSYKVTFVGKSRRSSDSSFGSLSWVYGKYSVRSPIAVTWQQDSPTPLLLFTL
ncbi:hypothetical protein LWI28_014866 [Acer negundo]|uniref:Uncharacterized protein n=1 Tax=Acer negundo TaxID=4023 RepID=A0AAD5J4E1_ACENE|nr:hypothetical protein LWI28_014866 [Acer negundo]